MKFLNSITDNITVDYILQKYPVLAKSAMVHHNPNLVPKKEWIPNSQTHAGGYMGTVYIDPTKPQSASVPAHNTDTTDKPVKQHSAESTGKFTEFTELAEVNKVLGCMPPDSKTAFGQWFPKLTQEEHSAIRLYTGTMYTHINNFLRKTMEEWKFAAGALKLVKQIIPDIQSGLDKFVLSQPITVYRKMANKDIKIFQNHEVVKDLGFISTTPIKGSYNPRKYWNGCIDIKIKVPAGKGVGAWVAPISGAKRENEFLLNRNTDFKVLSVQKNELGWDVELEVLPRQSEHQQLEKSLYGVPAGIKPGNPDDKFSWDANDLLAFKNEKELKQWVEKHG